MKKILFLFMIAALASGLYADGFKLMGGLNLLKYSRAYKTTDVDWGYVPGICLGAGVEIDLPYNPNIAFELDGILIQKKGKKLVNPDQPELNPSLSLSVLCIPALIRFRFKSGSHFYMLAGGEFSILTSHEFVDSQKNSIDLKEDTKKLDLGLIFGLGYKLKINKYQDLFFEVRYHHGLLNILGEAFPDESLKAQALLLMAGIISY